MQGPVASIWEGEGGALNSFKAAQREMAEAQDHAVRPPIGRLLVIARWRRRPFGEVIDLQTPWRSDSLDSQAARCGRPLATTASR